MGDSQLEGLTRDYFSPTILLVLSTQKPDSEVGDNHTSREQNHSLVKHAKSCGYII